MTVREFPDVKNSCAIVRGKKIKVVYNNIAELKKNYPLDETVIGFRRGTIKKKIYGKEQYVPCNLIEVI